MTAGVMTEEEFRQACDILRRAVGEMTPVVRGYFERESPNSLERPFGLEVATGGTMINALALVLGDTGMPLEGVAKSLGLGIGSYVGQFRAREARMELVSLIGLAASAFTVDVHERWEERFGAAMDMKTEGTA